MTSTQRMNQRVVLASHPQGMVRISDVEVDTVPVPALRDGEVQIETHYLSLDPAIRYWMNAYDTYVPGGRLGAPVRCYAGGRIVESRHPDYTPDEWVTGLLSAQSQLIVDIASATGPLALTKCDPSLGTLAQHLGVLGMPGMTAYFGLLRQAKPRAGETVFVSAASGTVGSTVGQLAKLSGCRVIGSAGSDAKCRWLIDELGFDAAFNYKQGSLTQALKQHAPEGVHVYFDNVGGDMLDAALANLARGARVVLCGALSAYNDAYAGPKNYIKLMTARGTMNGIIVFDFMDEWPAATQQMAIWLAEGRLKSPEHVSEGIASFGTALIDLFQGAHAGKQLVRVHAKGI